MMAWPVLFVASGTRSVAVFAVLLPLVGSLFASDPLSSTPSPAPPAASAPSARSRLLGGAIPFQEPGTKVTARESDIAAVRAIGCSAKDATRTARALALCDAWIARNAPGGTSEGVDRAVFLEHMKRATKASPGGWSIEATSTLIALATKQSLRVAPLTADRVAERDRQRKRVRDEILVTIQLIEQRSGRKGLAAAAAIVSKDAAKGFDSLLASEWSCVGQVPISSARFDSLIATLAEVREIAVQAAATSLAAPVEASEAADIVASAMSDVLCDGATGYARAAFVDGFAGRGAPLRLWGFSGEVAGPLYAITLRPTGELPAAEPSATTAPAEPKRD